MANLYELNLIIYIIRTSVMYNVNESSEHSKPQHYSGIMDKAESSKHMKKEDGNLTHSQQQTKLNSFKHILCDTLINILRYYRNLY